MSLQLRFPEFKDEQAFWRAYDASKMTDPIFLHYFEAGMKYKDWLKILKDRQNGIGLEPGLGPSVFLFAWDNDAIVGRLTFRHSIPDDHVLNERGHLGYIVLPEFRNKGYATRILKMSLMVAKQFGLRRVLVTCQPENIASRRTIEKCGGVFHGMYSKGSIPMLQFWISVK